MPIVYGGASLPAKKTTTNPGLASIAKALGGSYTSPLSPTGPRTGNPADTTAALAPPSQAFKAPTPKNNYTTPPFKNPGPPNPSPAGYEGIYQGQQALAEKAFQDAQTQLNSQRQQLYLDYGIDENGHPNANTPYGAYQSLQHNYNSSLGTLDRTRSQTIRDAGLAKDQLSHGYESLLGSLGNQEGDLRGDTSRQLQDLLYGYNTGEHNLDTQAGDVQSNADTSLSRLARDYGLQSSDLGTQRNRLAQQFATDRRNSLSSGADSLDAARAAGISRGLGTSGLGGQQSTHVANALHSALNDLATGFRYGNEDINHSQQGLDNSYGDSTSDVRTQLSRALRDIGTSKADLQHQYDTGTTDANTALQRGLRDIGISKDQAGYQYHQNFNQADNSLHDFLDQYNSDVGNLGFQFNANKANLGSSFAKSLAQNANDLSAAAANKSQSLADARMSLVTQALQNSNVNVQQLLQMFGYS
jgi:hypothetical protein